MSLAGLKKQFNKANQYVSEKIAGAKGTELDNDFIEMERKMDVMGKLVDELMARTHELLQPNPASRVKLSAVKNISRLRGQANHTLYPQPEGQLGDCMVKHGRDLGDDSAFGEALAEAGEVYKQLGEVKYSLEDNVKQNFIEPLQHLQNKDLKEVNHHRKKLEGRRLDFDCKKRKQTKGSTVSEEEIRQAEEKFAETKDLTETAMFNLLENDVEQISALSSFVESELNYHRQAMDSLQSLAESLQQRCTDAANRPRTQLVPKRISSFRMDRTPSPNHAFDKSDFTTAPPSYNQISSSKGFFDSSNMGSFQSDPNPIYATVNKPAKTQTGQSRSQPCAEALYDFDPENAGELGFQEGDIINLINQIDENWYEGSFNGQTGYFPVNYVKVIVDLP